MNYAAELTKFAHLLEQKGLVTGLEGNASVIDRETGLTYVTPSRRMHTGMRSIEQSVMRSAPTWP